MDVIRYAIVHKLRDMSQRIVGLHLQVLKFNEGARWLRPLSVPSEDVELGMPKPDIAVGFEWRKIIPSTDHLEIGLGHLVARFLPEEDYVDGVAFPFLVWEAFGDRVSQPEHSVLGPDQHVRDDERRAARGRTCGQCCEEDPSFLLVHRAPKLGRFHLRAEHERLVSPTGLGRT